MNVYELPPRTVTHKPSLANNLRTLVLNQRWGPRHSASNREQMAMVLKEPPHISGDQLGRQAEEKMDFREAVLSFDQPPLTKIDRLLERELAGRPISFQETDYTPALAASPFHIAHSYPSLWIVTQLGVSKNDHFLENIKLEKGSALRLFDIDLSLRTFGYTSPTLFCTIDHFICDELGFMIAKADTHIFSKASKYHILTPPPSFTIAIPKQFVRPADRTYKSNQATFGQHFYQKPSGRRVFQLPPRDWEGNPDWEVPGKKDIERWYRREQREMAKHWEAHGKDMANKEDWTFI